MPKNAFFGKKIFQLKLSNPSIAENIRSMINNCMRDTGYGTMG
jgi:hypothetical protein